MNKRPLLWLISMFVLGEVISTATQLATGLVLLSILGTGLCIWNLLQKKEGSEQYGRRVLLSCILLGIGMLRGGIHVAYVAHLPLMEPPSIEEIASVHCEKEEDLSASGERKERGMVIGEIVRLDMSEEQTTMELAIREITIGTKTRTFAGKQALPKANVRIKGGQECRIGNRIRMEGTIQTYGHATNPGEFDQYEYYLAHGIYYLILPDTIQIINREYKIWNEELRRLRKRIEAQIDTQYEYGERGILKAFFIGKKQELEPDLKALLQTQGVIHILTISGLHIAMLGGMLLKLFRKLGLSMKASGILAVIGVVGYGELAGFGLSTQRAIIAFAITVLGTVIGRKSDMLTSLGVAIGYIMLKNPVAWKDTGVWLSISAIAGVIVTQELERTSTKLEIIRTTLQTHNVKLESRARRSIGDWVQCIRKKVWESLKASVTIWLFQYPVLSYSFYQIPLYGPILNLLILPWISLFLIAATCSLVVSAMQIPYAGFWRTICCSMIRGYEMLCALSADLPMSVMTIGKPKLWKMGVYYAGLIGMLLVWKHDKTKKMKNLIQAAGKENEQSRRKKRAAFCIEKLRYMMLLTVLICLVGYQSDKTKIVIADVGQGDGIVFTGSNGTTVLLDGGSSSEKKVGTYILTPMLHSMGYNRIDYVVLSHMDGDHTSGVMELLEETKPGGVTIGCILVSDYAKENPDYEELRLLASKKNIPVKEMRPGDVIALGQATLRCLYPSKEKEMEKTNDQSLVLEWNTEQFSGILVGDLEVAGEETLIAKELSGRKQGYDFLKVGHHGSKSSTSEQFLNTCKPGFAIISYGTNRYGHPNQEVLERLQKHGCHIVTTRQNGAIIIDGESGRVETCR